MLFANADCCKTPTDVIRLYMHEAYRVYRDKLVDDSDLEMFDKLVKEAVKKTFDDLNETDVFQQPLMYCHFAIGIGDPKYMPVTVYADLNKLLVDALDNHNEINMAMNLVLFHVCHSVILSWHFNVNGFFDLVRWPAPHVTPYASVCPLIHIAATRLMRCVY